MRRKDKNPLLTALREDYAHDRVSIETFEVAVASLIRAESLGRAPRRQPSPREAARNWTTAAAASAANWTQAVQEYAG